MEKIAVIEDDQMIRKVLVNFLASAGYEVKTASDGKMGLEILAAEEFDLILLDIMLPEVDGLTILEKVRSEKKTPIIMITALDDEITQLASFNQLADDYVTKPFSPSILLKRVEAVLRRSQSEGAVRGRTATYRNIEVNFDACKVTMNEAVVILTKKEYEIVCYFLNHKGQVLQREQMLSALWDFAFNVDDRIINTHIKNIRKKLPTFQITTIKGMGYLLED